MKAERSKPLNMWGVRLIGSYFLIWAASDVYRLLTGTRATKGFLGIDPGITYNGEPVEVMGWIGACILFYTGFQLLRFEGRGRIWALIMLWLSTIVSGVLFLISIIALFLSDAFFSSFSVNWPWCQCKAGTAWEILLLLGLAFACNLIPLYFLLRVTTRSLFQQAISTGEIN